MKKGIQEAYSGILMKKFEWKVVGRKTLGVSTFGKAYLLLCYKQIV